MKTTKDQQLANYYSLLCAIRSEIKKGRKLSQLKLSAMTRAAGVSNFPKAVVAAHDFSREQTLDDARAIIEKQREYRALCPSEQQPVDVAPAQQPAPSSQPSLPFMTIEEMVAYINNNSSEYHVFRVL